MPIITENGVEYAEIEVEPKKIIPAELKKLTRKELKALTDEINADIELKNFKKDSIIYEIEQLKIKKEQYKLLLTQMK